VDITSPSSWSVAVTALAGPSMKRDWTSPPARYEARTIVFREWPDVERFDSLSAPIEHGFRVPPVATFLDGASVFGFTEPWCAVSQFRPFRSQSNATRPATRIARRVTANSNSGCAKFWQSQHLPPLPVPRLLGSLGTASSGGRRPIPGISRSLGPTILHPVQCKPGAKLNVRETRGGRTF